MPGLLRLSLRVKRSQALPSFSIFDTILKLRYYYKKAPKFNPNIDDCCCHLRYLLFYTATGVLAGLIWTLTATNSPFPAVGASGAISGVLGAYFIFYPRAKIRTLFGAGLFFRIIRLPIVRNHRPLVRQPDHPRQPPHQLRCRLLGPHRRLRRRTSSL